MFNSIWYSTLAKPYLNPPSWVFAPVWSILYLTILISFILFAVTKSYKDKEEGYSFFLLQGILNLSWAPVFFGVQNIGAALVVVLVLDFFVLMMISEFYKVSKISGLLLVPYALWILFATYLNFGFAILNFPL